MGSLTRNLDLTETVLNSMKKRTFFYNQLRNISFVSRQLRAGKIEMRFHFVQVERDSVGHSSP